MPFFKRPDTIRLVNAATGSPLCERCLVADTMWTRGKGLLGRQGLEETEGILLVPGTAIHMIGMKFAIDVIFLTREDVVTDYVENIGRGALYKSKAKAGKPYSALEMAAGTVARRGLKVGDQLRREAAGDPASK